MHTYIHTYMHAYIHIHMQSLNMLCRAPACNIIFSVIILIQDQSNCAELLIALFICYFLQ